MRAWKPRGPWHNHHQVVPSKNNGHIPKNQRWYFDRLHAVGWVRGEFNDILSFQPQTNDFSDHKENIRRIFNQFPQFTKGSRSVSRTPSRTQAYCEAGAAVYCTLEGTPGCNDPEHTRNSANEIGQTHDVQLSHEPTERWMPNTIDDKRAETQLTALTMDDTPSRPTSRKSSLAVQHDRGAVTMGPKRGSNDLAFARAKTEPGNKRVLDRENTDSAFAKTDTQLKWEKAKCDLLIEADSAPMQLLVDWCVNVRNTSVVHLWHMMDSDKNMVLTKREFLEALKSLGYPGNPDELWVSLDKDHTGTISFLEFVPEHALDLARLQHWIRDTFGSIHNFFASMDADRNGKLSFAEFARACDIQGMPSRLQESIRTLFLLCDDPEDFTSKGMITEAELHFLEVWQCPVYLWEHPDLKARTEFQEAVLALHCRNPLIAWRCALDRDCSMRVGFSEFVSACRNLARAGLKEADPPSGIPALYCALDEDRSGWFGLRDWDKDMHTLLFNFQNFIHEKYHKASLFVRDLEDPYGSGIDLITFTKAVKELDMDGEDLVLLFDGLSVGFGKHLNIMGTKPSSRIKVGDVLFLDSWQPQQEMKVESAFRKKIIKRMPTYF